MGENDASKAVAPLPKFSNMPSGTPVISVVSARDTGREAHDSSRFKTERWRERGPQRWPPHAAVEMKRGPCQFIKSVEIVPLQRALENPQGPIPTEIWTRSLRTDGLDVRHMNPRNSSLDTCTVKALFDRTGRGWTGRANPSRGHRLTSTGTFLKGPFTEDWVERPVAVGKVALNHMDGSRYAMDQSSRGMSTPHSARTHTSAGIPYSSYEKTNAI
eukprot:TRINITY_DN68838_c0_g1_i1.p1 TRINITY_DN68838_c0_g1~~TRINITY_DN68838_c0_g1_i1.p1  ORF type:complete len:216 (-),score=22.86 TRINITY_DN68838_c0_g1_i1:235-882(-)